MGLHAVTAGVQHAHARATRRAVWSVVAYERRLEGKRDHKTCQTVARAGGQRRRWRRHRAGGGGGSIEVGYRKR